MRIYIIGNDGITLCHEAPASVTDGEIAVASKEELHAAPLSGKCLMFAPMDQVNPLVVGKPLFNLTLETRPTILHSAWC